MQTRIVESTANPVTEICDRQAYARYYLCFYLFPATDYCLKPRLRKFFRHLQQTSKGNSHSWDIFPETWDMTPCFRVTIPGSWVYILVKKCRSQVRLFGKNQVYLVEVITIFFFFWYLIFKVDLININNPRNLGMLLRNMDIVCHNVFVNLGNTPKILGMLYIFLINL